MHHPLTCSLFRLRCLPARWVLPVVGSLFFGAAALSQSASEPLADYVDPFIGTEADGNVFVGPSYPFGMVKPGPDCSKHTNSGYRPSLAVPVYGFSQVHVSGTGGGPKYGNVSVMPFAGALDVIPHVSLRQNEKVSVGYYGVRLVKDNIQAVVYFGMIVAL